MALPFLDCIGGAAGVATTIKEIILQKPEIDSYSMKGSKCSKLTGQIEFKNVHFSYPSRPDSLVICFLLYLKTIHFIKKLFIIFTL